MKHRYSGKTVLIAGGSSGLGKEIALQLVKQGANVYILARTQSILDATKVELLAASSNPDIQDVVAISVDLSSSSDVQRVIQELPGVPDVLYCVAGGLYSALGFFTDLEPVDIESCVNNNFFSAAYISQILLKAWISQDSDSSEKSVQPRQHRQIVFVNSASALVGLPGYSVYGASKSAVRGLADALRMECLRLSNPSSKYTVHVAFPSNFTSEAFFAEQLIKPELTKEIEGTNVSREKLMKKFPSSETVATKIIHGIEKGDFALCDDSFESSLLFANMIGPSPKRGLGLYDSLLSVVVGNFVFPVFRRLWDSMCEKEGKKMRDRSKQALNS